MNFRRKLIIPAFILLSIFTSVAAASTPEPPAMPRDYVVDLAGVIRADVQTRMNGILLELEQKTTSQVLVLTVESLDGEDIRAFGLRMAEKWKLGRKGKDNGALLVVAVKDRKYTLETGYGLESILPDSMVGSIGRQYLVPYFRKGDYSTGIYTATLAVVNTIASSEGVTITGISGFQSNYGNKDDQLNLKGLISIIAFLIPFFLLFVRCPLESNRKNVRRIWMGGGYGGFGGGSFGSGGFGGFGGGGGSFGGGGGGGFGGGGASGGW